MEARPGKEQNGRQSLADAEVEEASQDMGVVEGADAEADVVDAETVVQ